MFDLVFSLLFASIVLIFLLMLPEKKELRSKISWLVATISASITSIIITLQLFDLPSDIIVKSAFSNWFSFADISIDVTYYVDPWSLIIGLISSWLTLAIIIFSWSYIGHSRHSPIYYSMILFFLFGMLLLLFSNNLIIIFFGWEIVGLCSWGLISYYYYRDDVGKMASKSGRKALITTGFADIGFIFAIYQLLASNKSLNLSEIVHISDLAAFGLLLAACGKSAQFPLHTWISSTDRKNIDAMQGPTTVSALIHAATMVNAGVYLIARTTAFNDTISYVVILIGSITALYAAISALGTYDMKRVLAYSTISQLGYMIAMLGTHDGSFISLWHLVNHAFFKCLLFLTIAALIHANHNRDLRSNTLNIRENKVIFTSLIIGFGSLIGIPPFAGFFSKDLIIEHLFEEYPIIGIILLLGTYFTAAYSVRMFRYLLKSNEITIEISTSNKIILSALAILSLLSSLSYYLIRSLYDDFSLKSVDSLFTFNIYTLPIIIVVILGIITGWFTTPIRKHIPTFLINLIFEGFYIEYIVNGTSRKLIDIIGVMTTKIQSGDHYWNMFFFILSATTVSSLLYFIQSGGIF